MNDNVEMCAEEAHLEAHLIFAKPWIVAITQGTQRWFTNDRMDRKRLAEVNC